MMDHPAKPDHRLGKRESGSAIVTDAFGCMVQGSFLTHMYSVGRHSRRSSSSRNRTGKPYAAHLARDWIDLLIYLPTQVQLTLTKIIKMLPPDNGF